MQVVRRQCGRGNNKDGDDLEMHGMQIENSNGGAVRSRRILYVHLSTDPLRDSAQAMLSDVRNRQCESGYITERSEAERERQHLFLNWRLLFVSLSELLVLYSQRSILSINQFTPTVAPLSSS